MGSRALYLLMLPLAVSACTQTVDYAYTPRPQHLPVGGNVVVGKVFYTPSKAGLAQNELRADGMAGHLVLSRPVPAIMTDALNVELAPSRIPQRQSYCLLNVVVENVEFDSTGFTNHFKLTAEYKVQTPLNKIIWGTTVNTDHSRFNMFSSRDGNLNVLFQEHIRQLLTNKDFIDVASKEC